MRWRAFYADGRRFSSADCAWGELPDTGLVVAVWWDDAGVRHLESGADALICVLRTIVGVNLPTLSFAAAAEVEAAEGRLKYGLLLAPEVWARIRAEADEARDPPEG